MTVISSAGTRPERRDRLAVRRPPGPKGLPFLGNLLEFGRDVLRYYAEWSREYGDIVALRLAGWPAVLINRPDYAEYVLVKNPQNFIKFPLFFRHVRAIFGQGLLTGEGEFGIVNAGWRTSARGSRATAAGALHRTDARELAAGRAA